MTSLQFYRTKFLELVEMHVAANKQAATWMEDLMSNMAEMITQGNDRRKAIALATRSLKLSITTSPNKQAHVNENLRIYLNSINSRWDWLDAEFKRLKSLKRMKQNFDLDDMGQSLKSHANHMSYALNGISAYQLDKTDPEKVDLENLFRVYSTRLLKKVNVFTMKETLGLSTEEREQVRAVVDLELNFFLVGIEEDWREWMAVNKENNATIGKGNRAIRKAISEEDQYCEFQLCDAGDAQGCIDSFGVAGGKLNKLDRSALKVMIEQNGVIQLTPVPVEYENIFKKFRDRFPNMKELADIIESHLNLMTMGGTNIPLQLSSRPLIIDGEAGIGKTMGVRYLSKELGVAYKVISCAELTNGFDISGQSRGWSSGKMGMVARMLLCERAGNGIVVLDEIDKSHTSESNFAPTQALYTLLERESSAHFKDEYIAFELDASKINWMGTSNYFDRIPEPIRDRSRRVSIPAPTTQQRCVIAKYLYADLKEKNEHAWGRFFVPELSDGVAFMIGSVEGISVRGMREILVECLAKVASGVCRPVDAGSQIVTEELASKVIGLMAISFGGNHPMGFIH